MRLFSIKALAAGFAFAGMLSTAAGQQVTGAGATFPAPLYAKWADAYNKATGVRINYQSVGSGAGLRQIRGKTVDFGASDMMEDPRSISACIDTVWAAKAIERIGDHSKNVAEHVIFISRGWDARHQPLDEVERAVARA